MTTHASNRGPSPTLPHVHRVPFATVVMPTVVAAIMWWTRAFIVRPAVTFMWWNLFLAWLPWVISTFCTQAPRRRVTLMLLTVPWLLLLPNAPYLLTDLVHLRERHGVSLEFDVLLFASFALAGCALGWVSLRQMHHAWEGQFGKAVAHGFDLVAIALTGFGVYLGRFLRLNSWDVLTAPGALAKCIVDAATQPDALLFSLGVAAFFAAGYSLVFHARPERAVSEDE